MAGAFRYFLTSSNVGRGSQAVDSFLGAGRAIVTP